MPISKLSNEILLIIFTFYIREAQCNYNGPLNPSSPPRRPYQYITISHICTHWRELIVKYPAFWNWIVPASPSVTKMLLERSQQMHLLVPYMPPTYAFRTQVTKPLDLESLKLVSAQFHRAKTLVLYGNPADLQDIDAPLLEDLTYHHWTRSSSDWEQFVPHTDDSPRDVIRFSAKGLPSLRTLTLRTCPFEAISRLVVPTIIDLDLSNIANPPTPRVMAELLAHMPNLLRVQLQVALSPVTDSYALEPQSHITTLPRLQKLCIMGLSAGISSFLLLSYLKCRPSFVTIIIAPSALLFPFLGLATFFAQSLLRALPGPLVGLRVQCNATPYTTERLSLIFSLYTIDGAATDLESTNIPRFQLQVHVHYDMAADFMLSMCCELAGPDLVDLSIEHQGVSFLHAGFWYVVSNFMPNLKNVNLWMEAARDIPEALEREYTDEERASIQANLRPGRGCVEVQKYFLPNLAVLTILDARWRLNHQAHPTSMPMPFAGRPNLFTRMLAALKVRRERGLQLPELHVYTTEVPWRAQDLETLRTGDLVRTFRYTEKLTFERFGVEEQIAILTKRETEQFARIEQFRSRMPPEGAGDRIDPMLARLFMGCIELICEQITRLLEVVSKPQYATDPPVLTCVPDEDSGDPDEPKTWSELKLKVVGQAYASLDKLQEHVDLLSTRLAQMMDELGRAEAEATDALAAGQQDGDHDNNDDAEENDDDGGGDEGQDDEDNEENGDDEDGVE